MTEVFAEYENAIDATDASVWAARACGRPLNGNWEAWIEFIPLTAGESLYELPARRRKEIVTLLWSGQKELPRRISKGRSSARVNAPSLS